MSSEKETSDPLNLPLIMWHLKDTGRGSYYAEKRYIRNSNLPAGNVFGVFAVAGAVAIANLEDSADGASVLARHTLHANVVFAAVFRMSVTAEGTSEGHLTRCGTGETVRYFWETPEKG